MKNITNLFKSKTFWFNAASITVELTGQLTTILPPGTMLITVNAINILLRMITTLPLSEK